MNTKQIQQKVIVFGVVVLFFGVGHCCGLIPSPERLKAIVSEVGTNTKETTSAADVWNIGMLPGDLDNFDEQLDTIQEKLDKHSEYLVQVKKMIDDLKEKDPSHPYLEQLKEVQKALGLLKDRLLEIEKLHKETLVNVNHRVNVHVGGEGVASGAISTAGYVFGKICDVIKYFGPSILNYYVINQVFALMREHREAMASMMAAMQRMIADQTIHASPSQNLDVTQVPGGSLMNTSYALVIMLPLLYKMLQGIPSFFQKYNGSGDIALPSGGIVSAQPRAWRILGGTKIPVW